MRINSAGFTFALLITGLIGYFCFGKLKEKNQHVISKSVAVSFFCLVSLLIFAIIGVLVSGTGIFGMARGWASFADGYIWGVFSLPILAFFASLGCFSVSNHSKKSR